MVLHAAMHLRCGRFRYTSAMIPDAATIVRRRHTVTMIVRGFIALMGVWIVWELAGNIGQTLQQLFDTSWGNPIGVLIYLLLRIIPAMLVLAAMVFFHGHLVRWIVPMPSRHAGCPTCGYSLRDLKSPICPECGTSLSAAR